MFDFFLFSCWTPFNWYILKCLKITCCAKNAINTRVNETHYIQINMVYTFIILCDMNFESRCFFFALNSNCLSMSAKWYQYFLIVMMISLPPSNADRIAHIQSFFPLVVVLAGKTGGQTSMSNKKISIRTNWLVNITSNITPIQESSMKIQCRL